MAELLSSSLQLAPFWWHPFAGNSYRPGIVDAARRGYDRCIAAPIALDYVLSALRRGVRKLSLAGRALAFRHVEAPPVWILRVGWVFCLAATAHPRNLERHGSLIASGSHLVFFACATAVFTSSSFLTADSSLTIVFLSISTSASTIIERDTLAK